MYEVEVKALLGSPEKADEVRAALRKIDPSYSLVSKNKQLNHYFVGGNLADLSRAVRERLSPEAAAKLDDLAGRAKEYSVRTRDKEGKVLLVAKVSVGDDSSANGVARMEFEEGVALSLDELDSLLVSAGFSYQAKWSREREEYQCMGLAVTLDKNAGYGWLAEFELVVDDASKVAGARTQILTLMQKVGVAELPQDRLERMFAYYNAHWQEYYGTEKIFNVD